MKPFDPVLSDWWNETISNRELVPVPLPLRLREGSLMNKMTRLASGKTGKTDLRWLSFDPFGEVIGSYQKKGVEEGARDLRIKVPSGQERTDL